jgi:D-alanine-D-alanine ligase
LKVKKTIGLICGGIGFEHEVDLLSTRDIDAALDRSRYDVVVIGIDKSGYWHLSTDQDYISSAEQLTSIALNLSKPIVYPAPEGRLIDAEDGTELASIDIFFPITDDPVHGLLEMLGVPFIGSGNKGSVVCRNKDITKRLLHEAGFTVLPYLTKNQSEKVSYYKVREKLGPTIFIKPNSLGSSIGVYKATNKDEFNRAVDNAFKYDKTIIMEKAVEAREIECAVLGNQDPKASEVLGEITGIEKYFDFSTKYSSKSEDNLKIPAEIDNSLVQDIRETSVAAYRAMNCEGAARVDLFLTEDNEFIINEINASPGLGKNLMYSKLWQKSGLDYSDLLDNLIQLAIERHTG